MLLLPVLLFSAAVFAADLKPYHEPLRPQYHFSPAKNWTNDPNGLVYYKGEYHLFYQHNPFGDRWGHMSWGHAVSADLVHWKHLPLALAEENGIMIFSGSVVVDRNTSGLCAKGQPDCLVAIYTGHTETRQTQHIAVSNDRGRTWIKYASNPVLDIGLKDFRDPKVFWDARAGYWVMVVALPTEHRVRFYRSLNLREWTPLSDFGPAGAIGGNWECPDLFELPIEAEPGKTAWVLSVNLMPGGVQGGSGNQYFVGDFDGAKFTNANPSSTTLWADYGADFYASTSFSDIPASDGRRIWLGWMTNWLYANDEPTSPWRGLQSLPRELRLRRGNPEGLRLVQEPVRELRKLRRQPAVQLKDVTIAEANGKLAKFAGQSYEIEWNGSGASAKLAVLTGDDGEETVILEGGKGIDRGRSGNVTFSKEFTKGPHLAAAAPPATGPVRIFVDASTVEIFAGGGANVISERVFPSTKAQGIRIDGPAMARVSLTIWKLEGTWK